MDEGGGYTVRRRRGTRYLRAAFDLRNTLIVSVPWHCSEKEVRAFVARNRAWIDSQRQALPEPRALSDWLEEHPHASASGDRFQVRIERNGVSRTRYRFERNGSDLVLQVPADGGEADLQRSVRAFASDGLHCRTAYHAKRLDLRFSRLSVRDQSSRWGSCSAQRAISLNWRLVLLPPELQDYVILHELAHLTEMNHSVRFWELLDRYDPDRETHEAALDESTPVLMRVGRGAE